MESRWVITGQMRLLTAAHFGGTATGALDMPILRDPDGQPFLPGTSLAGALRSHLADVLGGYRSSEDPRVAKLFGVSRKSEDGSQSPIIVYDSNPTEVVPVEIRDGVAIDPATGTAKANMKFDFEVLPAGTLFPIRIDLIVPDRASEAELLNLLILTLNGLTDGSIALGLRRSRGLGKLKVDRWAVVRHDLASREGWLGWVLSDHEKPECQTYSSILEAVQAACPNLNLHTEDQRKRFIINLNLRLQGDLLVRSAPNDAAAPDVVQLRSASKPVLPGTSLAGVLRAHALRISRLVRKAHNDAELWIDEIFGVHLEGDKKNTKASRLRVSEQFVEGARARRQARIAIDRFTGGVVNGALFDEEVVSGGSLQAKLELRCPNNSEIGLILLVVKDLLTGVLPVGGSSSVGRGFLCGTATVSFPEGKICSIGADLSVDDEDSLDLINSCIKAFHDASALNEGRKHES